MQAQSRGAPGGGKIASKLASGAVTDASARGRETALPEREAAKLLSAFHGHSAIGRRAQGLSLSMQFCKDAAIVNA